MQGCFAAVTRLRIPCNRDAGCGIAERPGKQNQRLPNSLASALHCWMHWKNRKDFGYIYIYIYSVMIWLLAINSGKYVKYENGLDNVRLKCL